MSLPLTENPAVLDPHKALTPRQQEMLKAVAGYEGRRVFNGWRFRNDRSKFSLCLADTMKEKGLIVERTLGFEKRLRLTDAGKLALDKLTERRARA